MKRIAPLLAFACLQLAPGIAHADLQAEIEAQAKAARAILDPWHAEAPRPGERKLHLAYWTPSDREPAENYRERLSRVLRHIQNFYADEMERIGFGRRTIGLQDDEDGLLKIHLVKGAGPYADYNVQSGGQIKKECLPVLQKAGIDAGRETIVIFCNLGEWDPEKRVMRHKSPYYAGGSHRGGTAWQLDEPILDTKNLTDPEKMRDGQYGNISMGKHNSIFIGGVAHELGHALSLPHNKERPDEKSAFGTALMGAGNRSYGDELRDEGKGSFLTLAHAMRLASHPQFSGSVKGMVLPATAAWEELRIENIDGGFRVGGKVSSKIPIYAVVAYMDPEGGGDYNATTATAVPAKDGSFTIDCTALIKGKPGELRIYACHANGATARRSFGYSVGRDGTVDISAAQTKLALAPMVAALASRDRETAIEVAANLPRDSKAMRVAKRVFKAGRDRSGLPAPASVPAELKSIPLSDTKPSAAKVGWQRPTYDRIPEAGALLAAGGDIFEHGIYAHAPAAHSYRLDGKWKSLRGSAGMHDGHRGSVVFTITGDGKQLWRSHVLKSGGTATFEVDLAGVKQFELQVGDAGDGAGSDWGLWLEPVLGR